MESEDRRGRREVVPQVSDAACSGSRHPRASAARRLRPRGRALPQNGNADCQGSSQFEAPRTAPGVSHGTPASSATILRIPLTSPDSPEPCPVAGLPPAHILSPERPGFRPASRPARGARGATEFVVGLLTHPPGTGSNRRRSARRVEVVPRHPEFGGSREIIGVHLSFGRRPSRSLRDRRVEEIGPTRGQTEGPGLLVDLEPALAIRVNVFGAYDRAASAQPRQRFPVTRLASPSFSSWRSPRVVHQRPGEARFESSVRH